MRIIWTSRDVNASAEATWALLTDPTRWPEWGPSISKAEVDEPLGMDVQGTLTTVVGLSLNFEITKWDPGVRWSWNVAGIPATDHTVQSTGAASCRVGFGVPFIAVPYLAICQLALHRIQAIMQPVHEEKQST